MKDSIGWHLQEAWLAATMAGYLVGLSTDGPTLRAYENEGRYYGHAFRAAELAYDRGYSDRGENLFREIDRALLTVRQI